MHYIAYDAQLVPQAIGQITNKIVEVCYLLLSAAKDHQPDKWIRSVKMPGLCPGPFNELK